MAKKNLRKGKVVLASSDAFCRILEVSDLLRKFKKAGFLPIPCVRLRPPFSFDPHAVFAVVAGSDRHFGKDEVSLFPSLKVVSPFGTGVDHIDCKAVKKSGAVVINVPALNAHAVAEFVIASIMTLGRRVVLFNREMKQNRWIRSFGKEISGMKLGLVGLGHVGKEVARLALSLGMEVSAHDIVYDEKFLRTVPIQKKSFEALLQTSDVISLHVPLMPQTRHLLNRRAFGRMKQSVYLINTARGEVVDHGALLGALHSGKVAGALLDVFPKEPPFQNALLKKIIRHPRVIATPHVAAVTPETHYRVGEQILRNISAAEKGTLPHTFIA